MSTKKYFWLRQPSTFFQDPKIKKLRKIAGGDTYTIIYQKIMLLSIVNGGVIQYEHIEDSLAKELALILDEEEDNVRVTLSFMQSQGLLEELNKEEFLLPSVPALIGTETDSAERVRRFRDKHNNEKALHCNGLVTTCNTEIELEKELEKEIEKKRITKVIPKKEVFSFALSRDTQYSNLSEEYKTKLKAKCLLIDGDINRYEDFIIALQAKAYKYKDFTLAYKAWDKTKAYKTFIPEPEQNLGEDWKMIRIGGGKVIAINTITLESKEGVINTQEIIQQPTQPTQHRNTLELLKQKGLAS